jgi:cytochrome c553
MIDGAAEKLDALLRGSIPGPIDESGLTGSERELAVLLNRLFSFWQEVQTAILPLSRGELDGVKLLEAGNYLSSPFKELHSHLLHLTWQAKRVAAGDYSQRVDFMGEFSEAFNAMVAALDENRQALQSKIEQLEAALTHIGRLEGILPICAVCHRIRTEGPAPDRPESWVEIERYISTRTKAKFTHGLCPDCLEKLRLGVGDSPDP